MGGCNVRWVRSDCTTTALQVSSKHQGPEGIVCSLQKSWAAPISQCMSKTTNLWSDSNVAYKYGKLLLAATLKWCCVMCVVLFVATLVEMDANPARDPESSRSRSTRAFQHALWTQALAAKVTYTTSAGCLWQGVVVCTYCLRKVCRMYWHR